MMPRWFPVFVLGFGVLAVQYAQTPPAPLRVPLEEIVPESMMGLEAIDLPVREAEIRNTQASAYVARGFRNPGTNTDSATFEVHVCFYERADPNGWWTVSHRLCHMEPTWAIIANTTEELRTPSAAGTIRTYLVRQDSRSAVALFWYQTRDGLAVNGFEIRWNRLKASLLQRRSDETLVRVMVPVTGTQDEALATARQVAHEIVPLFDRAVR